MTKIFKGSGLVAVSLMVSSFVPNPVIASGSPTNPISACEKISKVMASQLFCHMESDTGDGEIQFLLIEGKTIELSGTGHYAHLHKSLRVSDVNAVEPHLSDAGAVGTSVRFVAKSGKTLITMDIPCGETFYAIVGYGQNQVDNQLPSEWSAECSSP